MAARTVIFLALVAVSSCLEMPVGEPIPAIQGLVYRILGEKFVSLFEYEVIPSVDGKDVFELDSNVTEKKPVLKGNNGVALASALNFYLKYNCNCSISWGRNGTGDQLNLPLPLPLPNVTRMVSPVKYRLGSWKDAHTCISLEANCTCIYHYPNPSANALHTRIHH